MTREDGAILSPDRPKADPVDDRLGYAPFAKHLAESISRMAPPEGLVVGLYGPWGSGKTTLLNFVLHYLQAMPRREQPAVVQFNPWWFSGHEDLTRRFLDQFRTVIDTGNFITRRVSILRNPIADLAELISETPSSYGSVAKLVAALLGRRKRDVVDLKRKVADKLKKRSKRLLVIIDDIDRLTADEIRQLFRAIKAVADFPNVVYLLAFDKQVAISALATTQGIPGEEYLGKIVQVPFELPLPDKPSLRRLLFERLDLILVSSPDELFDRTHWSNVYLEGIDHFINTARDIVRLTNTLSVTFPTVRGEVNAVDFVAMETLRVFCPLAYDVVRKNLDAFVGHFGSGGFLEPKPEDLRPFHDSWLEQVPDERRETVKRLLIHLFPKLESVWGGSGYTPTWESRWRRELRICSPDIAPVYFRLALPEGGVSNAEMKALLALARDPNAFGARLLELSNQKRPDGTTRARAFLERLEDFTEREIPLRDIAAVVACLLDVGDGLLRPEDERRAMFDFDNSTRIGRLVLQLLPRLDQPGRAAVLGRAVADGRAVSTIVHEVAVLGQQHGRYGGGRSREELLVTAEHLKELEDMAVQKVRDAAREGRLLHTPDLLHVLYRWKDWAGDEEPRQWAEGIAKDDQGLVELLEMLLQKHFTDGTILHRLDPRQIEPFVEPSNIIDRARTMSEKTGLTDNQRTALGQFIREYEILQRGQNPDDPFDSTD
jgi:predicted KAP-like P-loop ATPase